MKKQINIFLLSSLLATSFLFSCKKEEAPIKYASINISNMSPGAPPINFLLGTDTLNGAKALAYGERSGYVRLGIGAGSQSINMRYAGADTNFTTATVPLVENQHYSLYVVDSFYKISNLLISDNLGLYENGKAHIRFINLSPNVFKFDFVKDSTKVIFDSLAFKEYTQLTPINAGVYQFNINLKGTNTVMVSLPTMSLNTGKIYTVVVKGFVGTSGKYALSSDLFINKW